MRDKTVTAREEILGRLRAARRSGVCPRPKVPPLRELSLTDEQMIEQFTENLAAQTGVVYRARDYAGATAKLTEIARSEKLTKIMASTDAVVAPLDLPSWGKKNNIRVFAASEFKSRDAFKDAVFDDVEAGITGADFGVAESGTLGIIHDKDQPRLVSLAPALHIAVLPVERLCPVYEDVTDKVYGGRDRIPSHFTFITGPSMTADIQGVPFKGMHGPRKLIVILLG